MKIILTVLLVCFSIFGADIDDFASDVKYLRDYSNAFERAKKEDKILMMLLVADDCPWCKKLERATLSKSKVKEQVLNMVPLILDQKYDKDNFPAKYATKINPTIYFIDASNNKKIYEHFGYIKKKDFLILLNKIQKEFKK